MGEKASNQEVRERHREFLSIICPKHLKYIPFTSSLFLMKYFFLIIMFSVSSVLSLSQASALLVTPDEYVEWAYNQQLTRYDISRLYIWYDAGFTGVFLPTRTPRARSDPRHPHARDRLRTQG